MKAFPQKFPIDPDRPHHVDHNPIDTGMDLRDYFAAKAMQGFISNANLKHVISDEELCKSSYVLADAMMKAKKQ